MGKKAILIGATGLIGANLLEKLLVSSNYTEVLVIARKKIINNNSKLKQLTINLDELHLHADEIIGDDVFCCLGTTVKQTPNLELYKKIDYQYPIDLAHIAFKNGAKTYHLVSSVGADAQSRIFYTRTKGEVERDLQVIPYQSMNIYRPSLLDGDRKESRIGEKLMTIMMRLVNPILVGGLRKYRSIKIEKVASAMLTQAVKEPEGIHIYASDEIEQLSH